MLHAPLQKLRSMVHEIVGRINGHYGTLTHVPIHHLDRQLAFQELCALYAVTDVALVTSLRDGMNLVSYEYVACQSDNAGELCSNPSSSLTNTIFLPPNGSPNRILPAYVWSVSEFLGDGMWCAGVLVLSEFAGAAQSLGAGAILVNPWNITDMAAAIEDALTMSDQVRYPAVANCMAESGGQTRHKHILLVNACPFL